VVDSDFDMDLQEDIWQHPSGHPALEDGEIHVWRAGLDQSSSSVEALFEILSADEREKAERYFFAKDRNHFIVARGTLRKILGGYLDISPRQISFSYNRYGKPQLPADADGHPFYFNLSHARGVALFAVTRGQEVGIDIEFIDDRLAVLEAAKGFFSSAEISNLQALPSNLQTPAFFRGWTRKEAFVKALGCGVSYPLKELTVPIMPGEPETLSITDDFHKGRQWSLVNLPAEPHYIAALAVEGSVRTVRCWQWSN
jgi:4'-phosphopantetheinyl transferase